jgi:integrase
MANKKVTIWIGTRIDGQFRYLKPVTAKNNKLKPSWAIYKGQQIEIPGAIYYTHHYRGKKHVYVRINGSPQAAIYAAERLRTKLQCKILGITLPSREDVLSVGGVSLAATIDGYLLDLQRAVSTKNKRPGTLELFKYDLNEFCDFWGGRANGTPSMRLDEVTRNDVLDYVEWLQTRQKDPVSTTTARNKFFRVLRFLKHEKVMDDWEEKDRLGWKDAPQVDIDPEVETYEQEELERFFAACNDVQQATFKFLLVTGLREEELVYLYWDDLSFTDATAWIREKKQYDFVPKAWQTRKVPIPDDELVGDLKKLKARSAHRLVFPTNTGRPNGKLLQACKRIAKRAGLNCGVCESCVKTKSKECHRWYLHKFRATCATRLLQGGMDIESVREWLGHRDTESIRRYVKALKKAEMLTKARAIFSQRKKAQSVTA